MTGWRTIVVLLLLSVPCAGWGAEAKRLTLPNDLRVVLKPNWSTEVVAIELLLDVSAEDEARGQEGIRYLVQRLLLRGTARESGVAMGRRLAGVGGVVDATIGLDYVEIYALVPADGFEVALELLAQAVLRPAFSPEEVESQKERAEEMAAAARQEPFQETYYAFRECLYRSHPYGGLTLGFAGSVADISREDIVAFHRTHYGANRAVVAICGGVGQVRAMRAVRRNFGDWAPTPPPQRRSHTTPRLKLSEVTARERHLGRAHLIMGFPAPAVREPDYYAMQVIDTILGGGATARLPRKLREELGLVYTVSSFYPTLAHQSHVAIYAVTEQQHIGRVKSGVVELLTALTREEVSQEELERAKTYLLGSYALSHQRMKDQAYALAWYEILGMGVEFEERYREGVQSVTAEQVLEAAGSFFRRFVLSVTIPRT